MKEYLILIFLSFFSVQSYADNCLDGVCSFDSNAQKGLQTTTLPNGVVVQTVCEGITYDQCIAAHQARVEAGQGGKASISDEDLNTSGTVKNKRKKSNNSLEEESGDSIRAAEPAEDSLPSNVGACESATSSAQRSCMQSEDSSMQAVMPQLDSFGAMAAASASSSTMACSGMGAMSMAVNGALTAFKGRCIMAYTKCASTCENEISQLQSLSGTTAATAIANAKRASRQCNGLSASIQSATQNIMSMVATGMQMANCKRETNNTFAEICKTNPNDSICKGYLPADCSDPATAASNLTCVCRNNPSDPRCGGAGSRSNAYNKNGGFGGTSMGSMNDGDVAKIKTGDGIWDGSENSGGAISFGSGGVGGGAAAGGPAGGGGGGGGRGGAGFGSSGQGPGPQQAARGGSSGFNTKTIGGYGYGGGSMGSGSSGSSGSGGGGGGYGYAGRVAEEKVNLAAFLPGGKMDPKRAVAGEAGPDGITGPHSDIWKKINNRYGSVANSLIP